MDSKTISFRADQETLDALSELLKDGATKTDAIREALVHRAREQRRERMRRQALTLAADAEDLAEMHAVQEDLESLRAW